MQWIVIFVCLFFYHEDRLFTIWYKLIDSHVTCTDVTWLSSKDSSYYSAAGGEIYRMNMYTCIMNIQVPPEVRNQRAIAKMTSQITKNGHDVNIQTGSGNMCSG